MSDAGQDEADKPYEPTAEKLRKAREKGEVPRSTDLVSTASLMGFVIAALLFGGAGLEDWLGSLLVLFDQPGRTGSTEWYAFQPALREISGSVLLVFVLPMALAVAALIFQKALTFTPSKLAPKLSRVSVISNAKNKFGRNGLFEFFKSFVKLLISTALLLWYMNLRLPDMLMSTGQHVSQTILLMLRMCLEFAGLTVFAYGCIGAVDLLWQHAEHRRKNMMSRKEIMDETKDAEGDPHFKGERQKRGRDFVTGQSLTDVAEADVVIVNPTHFAVALKWSRRPGEAPACVAKGTDEIALTIRRIAEENNVPVFSDPPTARALHATVDVGSEIRFEHYQAVATAVRFADAMRSKARGGWR